MTSDWWAALWEQVYPNLVAAAVQGAAALLWARRHVRKLHTRLDRMHDHITELKEGHRGPQGN